MRLLSVYVAGFGKLRDADFDFNKEITALCEKNGFGKSTLAAFIRVMLFGFEGEKSRSELEKERARFAPWGGGLYGGNITIEARGRAYRIERTFGAKASGDTFALFDADTNLPSTDFSENIGEELFGINSESFRKTVFITQNEVMTGVTGSINAKIGAGSGNFEDMAAYDGAMSALTGALVKGGDARKTGRLARLQDEITSLNTKLLDFTGLPARILQLKEAIAGAESDLTRIMAEQKSLLLQKEEKEKEDEEEKYRTESRARYRKHKADVSKVLILFGVIIPALFAIIYTGAKIPALLAFGGVIGLALIVAGVINYPRMGAEPVKAEGYDLISEKVLELTEALNAKHRELNALTLQLDEAEDMAENEAELREQLASLTEEAAELKEKLRVIEETAELLTEAKESLTAKYEGPLKTAFDRYYALITGKEAKEFVLDANSSLSLNTGGITRNVGFLSRGMYDIAGICLRLAFIDAMSWEEQPFLILDEPFAGLDTENLAGAKRLIRKIAEDYQVIIFSCREEDIL
jgi:uncharacterized protein YhaN